MQIFDRLFRDSKGQTVIWEKPNELLRLASYFAGMSIPESKKAGRELGLLSRISLVVWSYKEMASGRSLFRKILGAATLAVTAFSIVRHVTAKR